MISLRQYLHLPEFVVCLDGPGELRFRARGAVRAIVGPFALGAAELERAASDRDESLIVAQPVHPSATYARGETIWQNGLVAALVDQPFFADIAPEHLPAVDVFARAYTDRVVEGDVRIEDAGELLGGADWTTVHPPSDGSDVRVLPD